MRLHQISKHQEPWGGHARLAKGGTHPFQDCDHHPTHNVRTLRHQDAIVCSKLQIYVHQPAGLVRVLDPQNRHRFTRTLFHIRGPVSRRIRRLARHHDNRCRREPASLPLLRRGLPGVLSSLGKIPSPLREPNSTHHIISFHLACTREHACPRSSHQGRLSLGGSHASSPDQDGSTFG